MTLIELLIVIVILPVLVGGVTAVVMTSLRDQSGVSTRLSNSADAQLTSIFYTRDVQSASQVSKDASQQCGANLGGTLLVGLSWPGLLVGGNATTTVVSYWQVPVGSSAELELVRRACPNVVNPVTAAKLTGPVSEVLVHPSQVGPGQFSVAIAGANATSGWVSTVGVSGITLAASSPRNEFQYSVLAAPRNWNPQSGAGGGKPLPPSLLLLGSTPDNTDCTPGNGHALLTIGRHSTLTVDQGSANANGTVAVNSANDGSVWFCDDSTLAASQLLTQDPNGSPPGTSAIGKGGHTTNNAAVVVASPSPDPLYVAPRKPSAPPHHCPGNADLCPGDYAQTLSINDGDTTLCPGVYYLEQGLSVSSGATLDAATNCGGSSTGVLFYVLNGSVSFGGSGGGEGSDGGGSIKINLSPLTNYQDAGGNTITNQGVLIYQDKGDSKTVSLEVLTGQGQQDGNGDCDTQGGGNGGNGCAALSVGSIIARSFTVADNVAATVGGNGSMSYPGTIYAPSAPVDVVTSSGGDND